LKKNLKKGQKNRLPVSILRRFALIGLTENGELIQVEELENLGRTHAEILISRSK